MTVKTKFLIYSKIIVAIKIIGVQSVYINFKRVYRTKYDN